MNEYVYKLNLPDIADVVISLDYIKNLVPQDFQGSQIFYPEPREIFKSEWLTYKNLEWDYVSLFIRTEKQQSVLHRDNPHSPGSLHWGINWVLGEDSVMEYWDDDKIIDQKVINDLGGKTTVKITADQTPSKQYTLSTGVYLVNASAPHRVTNLTDERRIAISLRSKKFRYENPSVVWRDIVEMFRDEILESKRE
jgi:hypothetical protein